VTEAFARSTGTQPGVYIYPNEQVALQLGIAPPAMALHLRNVNGILDVRGEVELSRVATTRYPKRA